MSANILKINSFISKQDCGMVVNLLENALELNQGGDYLNSAINQFKVHIAKGGGYFSNIIAYPHFSQKEISNILEFSNMPPVRLKAN